MATIRLTSMLRNVRKLADEAPKAHDAAVAGLLEDVQERARRTPGWDKLADNIEVWSNDGILTIGVRDAEFTSQAFALEYGDETNPPSPLFRTLDSEMGDAGQTYLNHLAAAGSISGLNVRTQPYVGQ